MQIIITTKSTAVSASYRRLRVPWLPDEITLSSGGTRVQTYEVINLGEVEIPSGTNLETISWEATLPGSAHKQLPFLNYTSTDKWRSPDSIVKMMRAWKKNGTPLTLSIWDGKGNKVSSFLNLDVILYDFEATMSGSYGDVTYSVIFKERRALSMSTAKVAKKAAKKKATKKKTIPKKHKVKKGDTLYKISVKYWGNGSMKKKLYSWNKKKIEKAAKKHGRKSSKKGKYLYKGTVLKLKKK